MKALVVGGTGPTGPHVVSGLRDRGYEITILHRGVHELPELDDLEHIHTDPHFREPVEEALAGRHFDLVVAMYGRLRHVAAALEGACDTFIGITGIPVYRGLADPSSLLPRGTAVPSAEDAPTVTELPNEAAGEVKFAYAINSAEQAVLKLADAGAFQATLFRYPDIYGPRQLGPASWSIIKRVLDDRPFVILPDNGLTITSRCAARNAAEFVLLAVDHPKKAAGQIFNVADDQQFSLRQWVQLVSVFAGRELDVVSLPFQWAGPGRDLLSTACVESNIFSTQKARERLGYRDAIAALEALEEEVAWYLEHPPNDETVALMRDGFDYKAEDELIACWNQISAQMQTVAAANTQREHVHIYPHPKQPNVGRDERGR